jgi:hypothetical protein
VAFSKCFITIEGLFSGLLKEILELVCDLTEQLNRKAVQNTVPYGNGMNSHAENTDLIIPARVSL